MRSENIGSSPTHSGGTQSIITVNESIDPSAGDEMLGLGAVYKGPAVGQTAEGPMLYAANFRHGTVDMFDAGFNHVKSFTDPDLPTGYAPFNVQVLGDKLFVTFALQDDTKHDDVAGKGNGFVDAFDSRRTHGRPRGIGRDTRFALGAGDCATELRQVRRRSAGRQFRRRHDQCVRSE